MAMRATAGVVDAPQARDGRAWWFLDTLVVEHAMATRSGPVVMEMTLPAGAAPPLHVHHDLDDSWYLLDGQMVVRSREHLLLARRGRWLSVPRGVQHAFRVVGGKPARILAVHDNDSFLELVRDLGEPAGARTLPPPTGGPGFDELFRSLAEHDVSVVGPSMSEEEAQAFLATRGAQTLG
jgi:mannose-6-phosphate isomerase-like protein (cupin superfamily)